MGRGTEYHRPGARARGYRRVGARHESADSAVSRDTGPPPAAFANRARRSSHHPVVRPRRVAGPEAGGAEARDQRAAAALRRRRGISPRASRAAATVRSTSRRVWAAERNQPSNCDGGG